MESTSIRIAPRLGSSPVKRSSFGRVKRKRPSYDYVPLDIPVPLNSRKTQEGLIGVPPAEKFAWSEYLRKHSLVPAAEYLFNHIFIQPSSQFETDDRLEGVDPQHESLFCVLHVVKRIGHRIRLRFDGYSPAADFYCNSNSPFLFPVGWCQRNNVTLQPPRGISKESFNWEQYLSKHRYRAAPEECFVTAMSKKSEVNHGFRKGMKLEAIDRKNPAMICIATVADVLPNHILLHFDGWDNIYDQWVRPDSQLIFPAGSAKQLKQALSLPQSLIHYFKNEEFTWNEYLAASGADIAPPSIFKKSEASNRTQFVSNSQVEAVDRRVPQIIRVATIANIDDARGILTLQYNGWISQYNIQCEMDSPEIYPPGYCDRTGHPLEPPTDEYYLPPYGDDGPCPIHGCRGIGHAKGPIFSKHQTVASCPYSEENFMQDCFQYERLEEVNGMPCKKRSVISSHRNSQESQRKRISAPDRFSGLFNGSINGFHEENIVSTSIIFPTATMTSTAVTITPNAQPSQNQNKVKRPTRTSSSLSFSIAKEISSLLSESGTTCSPSSDKPIPSHESILSSSCTINGTSSLPVNSSFSENIITSPHEQNNDDDDKSQVQKIINLEMSTNQVVAPLCPITSSVLAPSSACSLIPPIESGLRLHHVLVEELFPKEMWSHLSRQDILSWSVRDVADFVSKVVQLSPSQTENGDVLRQRIIESEIDGESMLLLQTTDFLHFFKLPLGIVVKIMAILSYVKSS